MKGKRQNHKSKQKEAAADDFIRLNKFIANSGLCSRRQADELIRSGEITVNQQKVTELGTKVKSTDEVRYKGKLLQNERPVYILLNKPKDYVTTVKDKNARKTVMELVKGACTQRIYPVGRLDRNTTGVLLLTNDGELAKRLTHPHYKKKKVYHVVLDKPVTKTHLEQIAEGVKLEDDVVAADAVSYVDPEDKTQIGIEIHTGQNRVIRRIFETLGYKIKKLDRVYFAGLTKKNLKRGRWRFLTQKEINRLKMNAFK
ncbi:MAG: rRNA pseudouridine synthase [Bacteroidales bacterium]|nr:rRNA pseudouridine synthase [Bacteroidales bacterium]